MIAVCPRCHGFCEGQNYPIDQFEELKFNPPDDPPRGSLAWRPTKVLVRTGSLVYYGPRLHGLQSLGTHSGRWRILRYPSQGQPALQSTAFPTGEFCQRCPQRSDWQTDQPRLTQSLWLAASQGAVQRSADQKESPLLDQPLGHT